MRIRSPLTEKSLYSDAQRQGRKSAWREVTTAATSGNHPARRLLRMIILLVLVLLLMREAADPQVYRNFFGALGAPLDSTVARGTGVQGRGGEPSGMASQGQLPTIIPLRRTIAALGEADRFELTKALALVRSGGASSLQEAPGMLLDKLASAAAMAGEVEPQSITALLGDTTESDWSAQKLLYQRLQLALDEAYMQTVSDATLWQPGDLMAFYRALEQGIQAARQNESASQARLRGAGWDLDPGQSQVPVAVGYVSLLEQSRSYRGRRVWLEGTVARVEKVPAESNPFGIDQVWLVWVKPLDGSERPVMGYASQLAEEITQLQGMREVNDGPVVRLDGTYLRRHLYQSARGSELAPVIVGRVVSPGSSDEQMNQVSPALVDPGLSAEASAELNSANQAGKLPEQLWQLVVVIFAGALVLTWVLARYTAKQNAWRRRMRHQNLPERVVAEATARDNETRGN
jgi:hypothetical protein